MADVTGLVLPFFGLILIGYLVARWKKMPADALGWLNIFIIYVALPSLFFKLISRTPIEQLTRFDFIVTDIGTTYMVFGVIFVIGWLGREATIPEATVQGLAAAYGNIGYMGPGLALLAFGERAAVPVALIFCFENMLHFIVAPALISLGGKERRPAMMVVRDIVLRIVLHPFIIATAIGFVAAAVHVQPPIPLQRLIDYLAQAAAPCALFAMGVTLALRPLKRIPAEIVYIVPAKLVLLPTLMYLSLSAAGNFAHVWIQTAVLLAALPTATNVFVIGQQYDVWQERASATVLITTLFSVLTVSGLLYLMRSGMLPGDLFP
ncbi:AEC family transporter [Rhizobium sp. C4]|uniref:AEC family transporter n=1 Tax=Rhizobium sp. C4 TaxID=1349800 RepID=UPI001E608463|nr:AEC family transporter [Rhizobium sp. C4]MCD2171436.1 AEC family transporter [Rhizobium sp. C4]